jgi:hypothetical protein
VTVLTYYICFETHNRMHTVKIVYCRQITGERGGLREQKEKMNESREF